jgi:starvation-inducible DNA-binding protein
MIGDLMKNIDIGLGLNDTKEIASGLSRVLADTYCLYLQTQNFHWNIKSPMFATLHPMLGEQYAELASAVDLVAERIRSLGHLAPATFFEFQELSVIKETRGEMKSQDMIECLNTNHEKILKTLRTAASVAAKVHDEGTVNILTERIMSHEKTVWMLRSSMDV